MRAQNLLAAALILLILPCALADRSIPDPVGTPRPTITVEFNEEVEVEEYALGPYPLMSSVGSIPVKQTSEGYAAIHTFEVGRRLEKGEYEFYIKAHNHDGLPVIEYIRFGVDIPPPPPFRIWVSVPELGVADHHPYDALILTERNATCRFAIGSDPRDFAFDDYDTLFEERYYYAFNESAGHAKDHALYATELNEIIYIACREPDGVYHFEELLLGWDDTPAMLSVNADPNPVTDPVSPSTRITATTDDRSFCTINDIPYHFNNASPSDAANASAYVREQRLTKRFSVDQLQPDPFSRHDFTYQITCTNMAGLESNAILDVGVDLDEALAMRMLSPGEYTNEAAVNLTILLAVSASCQATVDSGSDVYTLTTRDQRHYYTLLPGLEEGEHSVRVECRYPLGSNAKSFSFTIDRTAPYGMEVNATPGCFGNRLEASLSAHDELSGIAYYNYSVSRQDASEIVWHTTDDEQVSERVDDPEVGDLYRWEARPIDAAGNVGASATATSEILNASFPECDFDPPTITLIDNRSYDGLEIFVRCADEGTGCVGEYRYGVSTPNRNCALNHTQSSYTPIFISEASRVCAEVRDYNDNTAYAEETFTLGTTNGTQAEHCTNGVQDEDESDVDCGGSCAPCDDGQGCLVDEDCLAGYCEAGVCVAPSCSDGVLNGRETGIDCGGLCDPCLIGEPCRDDSDCTSRYCFNGYCQEASCSDYRRNQDESDVDCGGSSCPACADGMGCEGDTDCESGHCEYGICVSAADIDSDGDGLPDQWEIDHGLDPNDPNDAAEDPDEDGLDNLDEHKYKTDPNDPDTDGDGYTDGEEVDAGTDPLRADDHPESSALALGLLITGFLFTLCGGGYLVFSRVYLEHPSITPMAAAGEVEAQAEPKSRFRAGVDPLAEAARRRLEEKAARQRRLHKSLERHSLLDVFSGQSKQKEQVIVTPTAKDAADQPPKREAAPKAGTGRRAAVKPSPSKQGSEKGVSKKKRGEADKDAFTELEAFIEEKP